eukprot:4895546-Prorocentrum_lima.AAC.1
MEEAVARFDLLHSIAMAQGVHARSPTNLALKIIRAFHVPPRLYQTLFQVAGGAIPHTLEQ